MNVFKLEVHTAETQDNRPGRIKLNGDMTVKTMTEDIGAFSSVKKAERFIRKYLDYTKTWGQIVIGFSLTEKQVDRDIADNGVCGVCGFESRRSYGPDGKPLCESDYDEACEKRFFGRKTPVPFKENDIALATYDDISYPVMICDLPPTSEWWKSTIKGGGDYSDDAFTAVSPKISHFHPDSVTVFPYPGDPPGYLRKRLVSVMKRYRRACED